MVVDGVQGCENVGPWNLCLKNEEMRGDIRTGKRLQQNISEKFSLYKITEQSPFQQKAREVTSDRHSSRKKKSHFSFIISILWYSAALFPFMPKVLSSNF